MSCDSENSIFPKISYSDPNADAARGASITHLLDAADSSPRAESSNSRLEAKSASRTKLGSFAKRGVATPKPVAEEAERYLTVRDVARRFAVSVQTVWRWAKERSEFPKPVELSPGTTRWRMSDLIAFERGLSGDTR